MSSGASLTLWGEGASLALVGHPSSDAVTMKIPYGVDDIVHRPSSNPIFSILLGWLKVNLTLPLNQLRLLREMNAGGSFD